MKYHVMNNLETVRKEQRYTRPQLAELVGVQWETIKAYEKKGIMPSIPVALRLAKVLEVPVESLFWLEKADNNTEADTNKAEDESPQQTTTSTP